MSVGFGFRSGYNRQCHQSRIAPTVRDVTNTDDHGLTHDTDGNPRCICESDIYWSPGDPRDILTVMCAKTDQPIGEERPKYGTSR